MTGARTFTFLLALASGGVTGCAEVRYVGSSSSEDYAEAPEGELSAREALRRAEPYLGATRRARCSVTAEARSEKWCSGPGTTHIVKKGRYYYLTRSSYPYKTFHAYLNYAVRVHVRTGEVLPYEE